MTSSVSRNNLCLVIALTVFITLLASHTFTLLSPPEPHYPASDTPAFSSAASAASAPTHPASEKTPVEAPPPPPHGPQPASDRVPRTPVKAAGEPDPRVDQDFILGENDHGDDDEDDDGDDDEDDDFRDQQRTTANPSLAKKASVKVGSCDRDDAMFNDDGKPCADLVRSMYDQRVCASTLSGARYLTCVPPKNGSSYHKGIIFRLLGIKDYYNINTVHKDEDTKAKMKLDNFTSEQIASFFSNPDLPKYAVVRNPMIRILSGYLNSVEDMEKNTHLTPTEAFQKWIEKVYPHGFSVFLNRRRRNPHVRSQFEYCGFRHEDYFSQWKIFKFEEPKTYVDFIYDTIPVRYLDNGWGDSHNTTFRDFVLGPRSRSHNPSDRFIEYIGSMHYFDQLESALKSEIDFFGYQKEVANLRADVERALKK